LRKEAKGGNGAVGKTPALREVCGRIFQKRRKQKAELVGEKNRDKKKQSEGALQNPEQNPGGVNESVPRSEPGKRRKCGTNTSLKKAKKAPTREKKRKSGLRRWGRQSRGNSGKKSQHPCCGIKSVDVGAGKRTLVEKQKEIRGVKGLQVKRPRKKEKGRRETTFMKKKN